MNDCWIETYTGLKFDLLEPRAEMVCVEDIAHALARQCRFLGHVKQFCSVAEHSVNVSWACDERDALAGLLHDASEAYIGDLVRPLKHGSPLGPIYCEIEQRIDRVIAERFGISNLKPESVVRADNEALLAERVQLKHGILWEEAAMETWGIGREGALDLKIYCWPPPEAEGMFLRRYYELTEAGYGLEV